MAAHNDLSLREAIIQSGHNQEICGIQGGTIGCHGTKPVTPAGAVKEALSESILNHNKAPKRDPASQHQTISHPVEEQPSIELVTYPHPPLIKVESLEQQPMKSVQEWLKFFGSTEQAGKDYTLGEILQESYKLLNKPTRRGNIHHFIETVQHVVKEQQWQPRKTEEFKDDKHEGGVRIGNVSIYQTSPPTKWHIDLIGAADKPLPASDKGGPYKVDIAGINATIIIDCDSVHLVPHEKLRCEYIADSPLLRQELKTLGSLNDEKSISMRK
jgi:hypothetical protein